jgi:4-hydroxybenzoate polyprenyltransferase
MWLWTALMFLVGIGDFSNFSIISVLELILFTFPLNFYLYGFNDIYDWKSDRINDRKKGLQGIAPSDSELKWLRKMVWFSPIIFIIIALFSRNIEHILLSMLFVLLCFTYSYNKIRIKEIPILDTINSAAIYTIPGLIAYSLHASIFTLPFYIFLLILPYMGMHAVTTLVDIEVDKRAGMKTVGTVFGAKGAVAYSIILFVIALLFWLRNPVVTSVFIISIFIQLSYLFSSEDNKTLRFAGAAVLISFAMSLMFYFILVTNITYP